MRRHGSSAGQVLGKCEPPDGTFLPKKGNGRSIQMAATRIELETFPNSRAIEFDGLPRGKDVWVRVRARNTVGAGPWSDPATIMVT